MIVDESKPRIHAYSRVSTEEQTTSIKVQSEYNSKLCEELAVKYDATWSGECVEEITSGRTTRYYDREKFASLMRTMRKGDHLVIYKLDRLERKQRYVIELGYKLLDMGVTLHIVSGMGGQLMSLDTQLGRLIFSMFAWFAEFEVETLRERTKSALDYRRVNGYASGNAQLGFETKAITAKSGSGKPFKVYVPNKIDLQNIFRIVYLIDRCGWSFLDVGRAFHTEEVRTSKGHLWTPSYCVRNNPKWMRNDLRKIKNVYRQYKQNPELFFDSKMFAPLRALSEIEVAGKSVKAVKLKLVGVENVSDPTGPSDALATEAAYQSPELVPLLPD